MITQAFGGYGCHTDNVQLEMIGTIPEIPAGCHLQWLTNARCLFIHRIPPEVSEDDDGNLFETQSYRIVSYSKIANFEMYPKAIHFHRPEPGAICVLESVRQGDLEQLVNSAQFPIFEVCNDYDDPLCVAWPMFDHESPLAFTFFNPMNKPLPSFNLSLFVDAPKDFANRWIKDETCSRCHGRKGPDEYTVCRERDRGPLGDGNTYNDVRCRKCRGTGIEP